jgi:hypothetical protein
METARLDPDPGAQHARGPGCAVPGAATIIGETAGALRSQAAYARFAGTPRSGSGPATPAARSNSAQAATGERTMPCI